MSPPFGTLSLFRPRVLKDFIYLIEIKMFRIEVAADPLAHFFIPFVFRITNRCQKLFIAARAAAVFGWAPARYRNAHPE